MTETDKRRKQVAFKISSRTARMLGRQNVSNPHVAIIELIKNAYDADAHHVTVRFSDAGSPTGSILIEDDGSGMDDMALESRWLTIGTDFKEREPISPGGRTRTGAKGIGRFALDRLGNIGVLETFQSPDSFGWRIEIDWRKYDAPESNLESVMHELEEIANPLRKKGTSLFITELRDAWKFNDYQALYDDLVFLIPPLESFDTGVSIDLEIDEAPALSGSVRPLVRSVAEYELRSHLDSQGCVRHILQHRSGEIRERIVEWDNIDHGSSQASRPECGPVDATILFYLSEANQIKGLNFKLADLRRYLNTFRGIRIHRDGFQIKPYGSKGDDWLGLDARKQRSPEGPRQDLGRYRISNNQLIGTVLVGRAANPGLEDRTSREGLIENQAFEDLRQFIMDGIRFIEMERQRQSRRSLTVPPSDPLADSVALLKETVNRLDFSSRVANNESPQLEIFPVDYDDVNPTAELQTVAIKREVVYDIVRQTQLVSETAKSQLSELQLLRSLATVGIALATFAHEIKGNINNVLDELDLLSELLEVLQGNEGEPVRAAIDEATSSAERIEQWSAFVLDRVRVTRRIEQPIDVRQLIDEVMRPFQNALRHREIKSELRLDPAIPRFLAFPLDIEAIVINLLTNAVKALEATPIDGRRLRLEAKFDSTVHALVLIVEDSGPGIRLERLPDQSRGVEQIFDPFISDVTEDGTGMGLAVIDRIVRDMRGTISIEANGSLGGAEFTVRLPIREDGRGT